MEITIWIAEEWGYEGIEQYRLFGTEKEAEEYVESQSRLLEESGQYYYTHSVNSGS